MIVWLRPAAFEDPYEAKMAELGQQAAVFSRPSPPAAEIIEKLGLQGTTSTVLFTNHLPARYL
eukprot:COSAG06_NODE_10749_length_1623_cov_144.574803_4_plen_62_part_01